MKNKESTFNIISTDDGSESFHSNLYDENGHSTAGAKIETITHYIQGCGINDLQHSPINIFEVGFGIGIGFQTTLSELSEEAHTNFVSVEIDENLLLYVAKQEFFKGISKSTIDGIEVYTLKKGNTSLTVFLGDARKSVKVIQNHYKFDAIYQDAFSPKRNPILWTHQWFSDLKAMSKESCIMSTYSSSSSIRKSMIRAGWRVRKGVKFGLKRSSTRAYLCGQSDTDILDQLERSPAITLSDENAREYKMEKK